MSFSKWFTMSIFGVLIKKGFENALSNNSEDVNKYNVRQRYIEERRKNTPCKFNHGITFEEFSHIAHKTKKRIERIKNITICEAIIYCVVESQTGCSEWEFSVDYNNWGHITGTYWKNTENVDSNIPKHFGDMVSSEIKQLLSNKKLEPIDFSWYIDKNENLGEIDKLSCFYRPSFLKKKFNREKQIISQFDSMDLLGEHVFSIVSLLKSNGYKNIIAIPIKDIDQNSDKYVFEVEQIVINGTSFFEIGDVFIESVQVIVTYHAKKEILIPYTMKYFKKKNYIDVGDYLHNMGFSNVYERKIKNLKLGILKEDGSVEEVLVCDENQEIPFNKNRLYNYDTKIVITYHTFSK